MPSPKTLLRNLAFLAVVLSSSLVQGSHAVYYGFSTLEWRAMGLGGTLIGLLWGLGVLAEIVLFALSARLPSSLRPTALLAAGAIGAFIRWGAMAFDPPVLKGFNYRGGIELPPELVGLVAGLTLYTAAFIGETVRAGILSVSRGQTEAAQALGLKEGDRLRLVIIPQAMRVIIPPLTSQYLNLTKNSSLGAAIGFPELVNVWTGTTLNQTGRAIEVIFLTMAVYATFSLLTSAIMNWYNGRVALVER